MPRLRGCSQALMVLALAAVPPGTMGVHHVRTLMELVSLKDLYPDAVCVDGSPSGYYWTPATTAEGRHNWVVYLESGGWCWDTEECAKRCNTTVDRCSSNDWQSHMNMTGLFSALEDTTTMALSSANKAFVKYCTSDAHMGDAEAFDGLQFRGRRVVQAVLTDLVARRGMGDVQDGKSDFLLFGGGSAGSRGAMVHLDYVPAMLGDAAANIEVVGFLDSPLWLDVAPFEGTDFEGFGNQTAKVHSFANVTHLGASCAAAYPEPEQWKCMLGEYRMPHVQSRYLLVAAQHDWFQLFYNVGESRVENFTQGMLEYAVRFADRTATLMRQLASQDHAVFAPSCYSHAETLSNMGFFAHGTEDGSSVNDAIHRFLGLEASGSGSNSTYVWIDECRDLECGAGCHRGDCEGDFANEEGCAQDMDARRMGFIDVVLSGSPAAPSVSLALAAVGLAVLSSADLA